MKEPSASCCTHFDLQLGLSLYFIFSPAPRKGNQSITLSGEGCHKWFAVTLWTQDSSCTIVSVQLVFVEEKGQGGGKELYLLQTHLWISFDPKAAHPKSPLFKTSQPAIFFVPVKLHINMEHQQEQGRCPNTMATTRT